MIPNVFPLLGADAFAAGPLATVADLASGSTAGTDPAATLTVVQLLGFAGLLLAVCVLLAYLVQYRGQVLAEPYRERWRYLAVGIGAAGVYAVTGLAETLATDADFVATAHAFRLGATLFFFLFAAVGVRAMFRTATGRDGLVGSPDVSRRLLPLVLGGFVFAWWVAYLLGSPEGLAVIETVGLAGAVAYTLTYAVATVRAQEGTAIAAVTRQFTPALIAFAVVVVAEQAVRYGVEGAVTAIGLTLIGRVLTAAFLFATAVAIRQQGGEVSRLYDPTTWRGQDGASLDSPSD